MDKRCSRCGETKGRAEFSKDSHAKDGLQSKCRICQRQLAASWWALNGKESYKRHAEYQKAWKNRHKNRRARIAAHGHTRRKYGITEADFSRMVIAQLGQCAICGDRPFELHVDHCHSTERVRELLCDPCNRGLAAFRDNPERLGQAIAYLKKHEEV